METQNEHQRTRFPLGARLSTIKHMTIPSSLVIALLVTASSSQAADLPKGRSEFTSKDGGWNTFAWGMRRAEVFRRLRDRNGAFKASKAPQCKTYDPRFSFSVYCTWWFDDENFLVLGLPVEYISFNFIGDKLNNITLSFKIESLDDALSSFDSVVSKLYANHGSPTSRLPTPPEECRKTLAEYRDRGDLRSPKQLHLDCDFSEPPSYLLPDTEVTYTGNTGLACFGTYLGKGEIPGWVLAKAGDAETCKLSDEQHPGMLAVKSIIPITKTASWRKSEGALPSPNNIELKLMASKMPILGLTYADAAKTDEFYRRASEKASTARKHGPDGESGGRR
jgi:hypothetical protein